MSVLENLFQQIANSIRSKDISGNMTPQQMPDKIKSIQSKYQYGVPIDGFIGDVDQDGNLSSASAYFDFYADDISVINEQWLIRNLSQSNVQRVDFPNLISVGLNGLNDNCFGGCTALTSINFPKLSSLDDKSMQGTFNGDTSLTSVEFPSLKNIGNSAFTLTFANIPTLICASFPELVSVNNYGLTGTFINDTNLQTLNFPKLESVGTCCFYYMCNACSSLTSIEFPSLTNFGVCAFYDAFTNCSSLVYLNLSAITDLSVNAYFNRGFSNTGLLSINFHNLTSISGNVLQAAFPRKIAYVDFSNLLNIMSGKVDIYNASQNVISISMPKLSSTGDDGLRGLATSALNLTAISIPNLVSVGNNGLNQFVRYCSSLVSVDMPNLSALGNNACEYAFAGCTSLYQSMCFSALTSAPNYCFNYAFENSRISYADFVNLISAGNYAFQLAFSNNPVINSVNFNSLSVVTNNTFNSGFKNCTGIQYMNFPALKTTGNYTFSYAFQNCTNLLTVELPELLSVGNGGLRYAFMGCTSLKRVNLKKLSQVGATYGLNQMCDGCTSLEVVDFSEASAVPTLASINAFQNTNNTYKIVVPDNLYDTWIAAPYWQQLSSHIVRISDYYTRNVMVESNMLYEAEPDVVQINFSLDEAGDGGEGNADPIYLSVCLPNDITLGQLSFDGDYMSDKIYVMDAAGFPKTYFIDLNTNELVYQTTEVGPRGRLITVIKPAADVVMPAGTLFWIMHIGTGEATVSLTYNNGA